MELNREQVTEKAKQNKLALPIFAIFLIAVGLRYYPVRNIQYLQALDPYNLFRMSQQIAYTGGLPELDFMRNFPNAFPTTEAHITNLVIPALLYWAGGFLFFDTYLDFAHLMMPLFSGLGAVAMYFLGKELYDKYTGLGAAFFIAVLPGAMFRSSAGFFEKEATGTFFMILSLLFFVRAWKQTSWENGILAGLSLGIFTTTWGGSEMLWLLYPMIVGFMLLIDQNIRQLIATYTPTVIVAGGFASIVNPGNFWFTDTQFLLPLAFLGLLWARYLVEELNLLSNSQLPYFTPGAYLSGAIALVLSPLYSNTLAQIMLSIYSSATRTGGSVIGGTVAENAPPDLSQMVSQLGTGIVDQLMPGFELVTALFGAWTLTFLAIPIMASTIILMGAKRYDILDSLSGKKNYSLIAGIVSAWVIGFAVFFAGYRAIGIIVSIIISILMLVIVYYLDDDSVFTITSMSLLFTAIIVTMFSFSQQNAASSLRGIAYPAWLATIALGGIYYLEDFREVQIKLEWYKILPLFWLGSNLLGATAQSRLIYLATFPAALGAGYTLSIVLRRIQTLDLSEVGFNAGNARFIFLALIIAGTLSVNIVAGWAAVQNIQGSPNQAWMESLDYLEQDAPEGSVTMSWWDYGYHFQSLGRTASVADGGNFRYYVGEGEHINYRLADYFTSTDTEGHEEFLEQHSVDYIVLDNTMIGKYTAVSQISERSNENFDRMWQMQTRGSLEDSISQAGDRTVATYQGQVGIGDDVFMGELYLPLGERNGTLEVSESATMRLHTGEEVEVGCIVTDEGIQEFEVEDDLELCAAVDPYYNFERSLNFGIQSRMAVMDREVAESTLSRLYFMDGHEIPYAEKVEEGSNDYVKLWAVE